MIRNVYYPYDFETHKNLSHKQVWLTVYYFMDGPVLLFSLRQLFQGSLQRVERLDVQ